MNPGTLAILLTGMLGCSGLTATGEGVATILLEIPAPAEVEVNQTITLRAAALGSDGDTLNIPVFWIALDTTIVVDTVTGALTGRNAKTTGAIVARAGGLYSSRITFAVLARADTLVRLGPALSTVPAGESLSQDLQARLDQFGPPSSPVQGRRLVYQLVEPVFGTSDERTVEFTGGGLTQSATTSVFGTPPVPIRVRPVAGRPRPDSAIVTVSAWRPGGAPIPGSGHRFIIRFALP